METLVPPPFITFAIPAFFLLIGIEVFWGILKKKDFYRLNDSIADLSTGILSQISGFFLKGLTLFAYFYVYENFRILEIGLDSVIGWVACMILWDFCYYWFHRLSHEVNFFWAGHVIHHHSEEYNLVVALRQTGVGSLSSWVFYMPLAVIGFPPWMFLASGQLNLIYQFWVHTKAVKSIGTVGEFLLSTPSHHRVHHAINPQYIDKNHGGILIIWDRLFGTFRKEEEPCVYGTVKPLQSFNPVWANLHYYWELLKTSFQTQGFLNKLKVWIKPPGWYPAMDGKPEGFHPIPTVSVDQFVKYNPEISKPMQRYILSWFVITLLVAFAWLVFVLQIPTEIRITLALWIGLSLVAIGALLESKPWAMLVEGIRLGLFPLMIYYILGDYGVTMLSFLLVTMTSFYLLWQSQEKKEALA